ncbi:MAG: glutamine--tRNA ligase/YqeY domain fusion protein [Planctomycetes bacterium]|nr:glutamine--tRNA ligase/YqeY domain fusion protein [Planctomycetota bacterium]
MSDTPPTTPEHKPLNFLEQIIEADNASGKWGVNEQGQPKVHTRFPPEPNGYLHIGHAKSICLNSGLARKYHGAFNLRFDDTNPAKEEQEYVDAIIDDVAWLTDNHAGYRFGGVFWASDYFEHMYECAVDLIRKGKAYVCDLSADEVSKRRGTPGTPATSPFRDRPIEESLRLFAEMRDGKHPNGSRTLRAKIDLASPNFVLRDPVMYRILHEAHHNTGTKWCIYPMYDWAHGLEDSLEGITHSICTLEFRNNRPLYDWFIQSINEGRSGSARVHHPQQIEFARLNLTYTVMSKRFLLNLVKEGRVSGWDDPRMPTIRGLRRRGYTARSLRALCDDIGVTTQESVIDVARLENAIREDLNATAPRAMCVLNPIKVVIENWPEGKVDELDFVINPEEAARGGSGGTRKVPFSKVLYIERDDFMENPPKNFFRLSPGREVRLRWAYFITCTGVEKDAAGNITEIRATYDPATRGGDSPLGPDGKPLKKVKGTLHWISADHAVKGEVRLFDRLFSAEEPGKRTGNQLDDLNPNSLVTVQGWIDPAIAGAKVGGAFQFERLGYFCVDKDSKPGSPVFNRTVTLKDNWAKESGKGG